MKLLYKQLTKKQWILWSFTLFLSVIYIGGSNFSIVLLSYFVNLLSVAVNPEGITTTATTVWDQALANIFPAITSTDPTIAKQAALNQAFLVFGITIALTVISTAIKMATRVYLATLTMQMLFSLRNQLYHKIMYLDEVAFNKISPTSIINRVTNDMYQLQEAALGYFMYLYESVFYVLFNIIFSITLSPLLSTTYIFFFPLALIVVWITQTRADKYYDQNLIDLDRTNQIVRENLIGIRIVKSFNVQKHQYRRFLFTNKSWKKTIFKSEWIVMIGLVSMFLILNLAIVAILIFGGGIIKDNIFGGVSEGVIVAFLNYVIGTVFNIYAIGSMIISLIRVRPVNRRFHELLKSAAERLINGVIPETFKPTIRFENVNFSYEANSSIKTLENINLEIQPGQTVGIIGPTGSGKSSLVNLIARLYEPDEGKVLINELPTNEINLQFLRSKIGFAPQDKLIFAGTIKSNIKNGKIDATDEQIQTAAKLACAHDFINLLPNQYNNEVSQYGSNLSGGQKQRLSLARCLVRNPEILILDDTVSALDNLTRDLVLNNLKNNLQHATKIIVSQQIKTIREANNIIVMDKGKIVAQGVHQQLLKNCELYRTINESQKTVGEP
ncbi:ABC transporter ATP-binding protein [[Mycoplasma] testudinis]|uniref:ABC transporter ATP-binding protein n=1 Tax=[Mycoplasma] testudinis TaxID=33924 RepID=UPI0004870608|nr:ABC transporter ATP-binding protein [[Mycoplasma] testudinis]